MPIELNHTIVHASNAQASAAFLAELLGRPTPVTFGPFYAVELDNRVTLDFIQADDVPIVEHYAFLVSEQEFDEIWGRIQARGITYYPEPFMHRENEINHNDGGRGLYFLDPSGHGMEIITRPYGSGDQYDD